MIPLDSAIAAFNQSKLTQAQHFEQARRRLAEANATFMELVNHPSNPMTREDLAANIARRPALWSRYAGFLETLPTRADMAARKRKPRAA